MAINNNDLDSLPNWNLIDEISIPLLETGIGTLPILQAALPSVLAMDCQDENVAERYRKVIRISQLQIQHLLKSQAELLKHLEKLELEVAAKSPERKRSLPSEQCTKYKCADCGKLFLNRTYLTSHFERRHPPRNSD